MITKSHPIMRKNRRTLLFLLRVPSFDLPGVVREPAGHDLFSHTQALVMLANAGIARSRYLFAPGNTSHSSSKPSFCVCAMTNSSSYFSPDVSAICFHFLHILASSKFVFGKTEFLELSFVLFVFFVSLFFQLFIHFREFFSVCF